MLPSDSYTLYQLTRLSDGRLGPHVGLLPFEGGEGGHVDPVAGRASIEGGGAERRARTWAQRKDFAACEFFLCAHQRLQPQEGHGLPLNRHVVCAARGLRFAAHVDASRNKSYHARTPLGPTGRTVPRPNASVGRQYMGSVAPCDDDVTALAASCLAENQAWLLLLFSRVSKRVS